MNTKYLYLLKLFLIMFLVCFLQNQGTSGPSFFPKPAWGAQQDITSTDKWQTLVNISGQRQIPGEALGQILTIIRQAEKAGYPHEILLNKAIEGATKGVSVPVIERVLQERLEHFRTCNNILRQMTGIEKEPASQRQQALAIIAESLSRGVSGKELEELSQKALAPKLTTFANASESLATLRSHGFSSVDAMEIVQEGLQHGLYKKREQELTSTIIEARQRGESNQALKERIIKNIRTGRGMRETQSVRPNKGHTKRAPRKR